MNTNGLSTLIDSFTTVHGLQIVSLSNINDSYQEHNIVYKMINKLNGKYYIGQHVTINPLDEYSGSGYLITKAIHKYKLSSFIKEILFDFDNFEEMNEKEKELVPLSSCYPKDPMSYNLMEGGHCGRLTEETKKKISESKKGEKNPQHKTNGRINPAKGKTILERFHNDKTKYDAWRKSNSEGHKGVNSGEKNGMYGKNIWEMLDPVTRKNAIEKSRQKRIGQKRTSEQKKRIREGRIGKNTGKNHHFYGKPLKTRLKNVTYDEFINHLKQARRNFSPIVSMTNNEIIEWKQKLSKSFTGRIRIYNPISGERHLINANKLQSYLDTGWVIGYNCSSIGGKIAIHNPITQKTKYITEDNLENYIANGWLKGAYVDPNKIHKIAIYNDIVNKIILIEPHQYPKYYYDGWSLDLPSNVNKGKIVIRNELTHQTKTIQKNELKQYLDAGWLKGRFPNSKPK